jgi:hypothetical protein
VNPSAASSSWATISGVPAQMSEISVVRIVVV